MLGKDITIDLEDWRINCRAAGVIIHNNKILLHRDINKSYYALVGGRIKFGETSDEAIVREIKEELGKDVEIIEFITVVENLFKLNNRNYQEYLFIYKLEFKNEKDKLIETTLKNVEGEEESHVQYEWVDLNDLDNVIIKPKIFKEVLQGENISRHKTNNDLGELLYNQIINDQEIINIYNKIATSEDDNFFAHHDLNHVMNVVNLTEKIMVAINAEGREVEEAKIAAYMHDTGVSEGKQNHGERSYDFAKKYFANKNIKLENENLILNAIKNHSDGFETDNVFQLALILADKLDIKSTRVTSRGLQIEGMRQMQYIKDIDVKVVDNVFIVKFICDERINKEELEEYYFMKKVGYAIKSFCNKFNMKYEVLFNNKIWKEIL